ncbi:hypothetical protein HY484_02685 [Candidatus Woesearchaeota archaeon]|nr:hypothetical protein [Candidatus Woesearchaeota archaeon]
MFVRIKKIQNKNYAYLVANEWTTAGSRQKVKAYLGKVHTPEKKLERSFVFDSMKEFQHSMIDAIKWELENHGFKHHNNNVLTKEGIIIDLHDKKVSYKNRKSVVALNEGYLCEHTITELLNFKASENNTETSTRLATKIVESGIKLPTEAFVQLFEKVVKTQHP